MPSIFSALEWLEGLAWTTSIRESNLGYPLMETSHVACIVFFAGLVMVMDLRLVGLAFAHTPLTRIQRPLFRWQMVTFFLSAATGLLLFVVDPLRYYGNIFFRVKLVLLALAGLNALGFHLTTFRSVARWDEDRLVPTTARLAGAVSLFFWSAIIVTGRLIAYNWFD